jgi:hypothetical protein
MASISPRSGPNADQFDRFDQFDQFFSHFESLSKKLADKWWFRSLVGLVSSRMQLFEECVSKLAKNLSNPSNSSFEADGLTGLTSLTGFSDV